GAGGRERRVAYSIGGLRPSGGLARADRVALRIEARLRQLLRPFLGDDDIAAFDRLIGDLPQRLGPRLAGQAAVARWAELLAIAERRGQLRVEPAADRHRARDVLAGIAVAVEAHLSGGAQPSAQLFVLGEFGGHRGIG